MELSIPQHSLDKSLSDDMQEILFERLKPAVWGVATMFEGRHITATAFCVDSNKKLLVTAAHTFEDHFLTKEWNPDNMQDIPAIARRDLDPDNAIFQCTVVDIWESFDIAFLQVHVEGDMDYVSFDKDFVDSGCLPLGIELFSIAAPRRQGFHLLRGVLGYEYKNDGVDYSLLDKGAKKEKLISIKETNFGSDNLNGGVIESSMRSDLHPKLRYLQMEFGGVNELVGSSGSAVFNCQGKVVGMMLLSTYGSIWGVSSIALNSIATVVKANIEKFVRVMFKKVLLSCGLVKVDTQWQDVQHLLEDDIRYTWLPEIDLQKVFQDYILDLEKGQEEEKKKKKKDNKRKRDIDCEMEKEQEEENKKKDKKKSKRDQEHEKEKLQHGHSPRHKKHKKRDQ